MFLHPNFTIKRGEILKQIWHERIRAKFIRRYFCAFKCKFLGVQSLNAKQILNTKSKTQSKFLIAIINLPRFYRAKTDVLSAQ
jgi:hypothetical protein